MIDKKFAEHFARDWIDSWNFQCRLSGIALRAVHMWSPGLGQVW
jgi:hypothetical protein